MTALFNLARDGDDVQAIVRAGFQGLIHCRFLLLQIKEPVQVRAWIAKLLKTKLIKTVADVSNEGGGVTEAFALAFSYGGLSALQLTEHNDFPFPTAFRTGMAEPKRMPLLGDRNRNAWTWGDIAAPSTSATGKLGEVHLLAAHYRMDPFTDTDEQLRDALKKEHGLDIVKIVHTCPYYIHQRSEPFGFKDGLAQPVLTEMMKPKSEESRRDKGGATFDDDVVPAGEFVLGHANAYAERSYCPDLIGWKSFADKNGARFARNGSYLAIRQIEQDVAKFNVFDQPDPHDAEAPSLVEKMIGRRRGGDALVDAPPGKPKPEPESNDFRYRLGDFEGFQCPRGAHIRRANPRDALGWDVRSGVAASKLHRLIRRGRVFTENPMCGAAGSETKCGSREAKTGCGDGLFFIALNADLDRQFEFVQQRWFANSKFADLWDEADPALGYGTDRAFSMPGYLPIGTRRQDLPQFTTVTGGGYFFLPGLRALEFIARPAMQREPRTRA